MNNEKQLIKLIHENEGMILSSQVDQASIPRVYITQMVKNGLLEKIARGVYLTPEHWTTKCSAFIVDI